MKTRKKLIIFLFVLSATLLLLIAMIIGTFFWNYDVHRNVAYGEKAANVMDIYIPRKVKGAEDAGCVLFVHGGSWSGGDKKEETIRCRVLASRGYIAASVNYTLWSENTAKEYTVFEVLDELDAALLTLKTFSAERGISVTKAATAGYSAGAHLAMLYAYSRSDKAPLDITFVASMAGPADITPEVWGAETTILIAKCLTGKTLTEDMLSTPEARELLATISPTAFVSEKAPPTIVMQGAKDPVVPPANADSLIQKLSLHAVTYSYIHLKNSDHSLMQNPTKQLTYFNTLLRYCHTYFGS